MMAKMGKKKRKEMEEENEELSLEMVTDLGGTKADLEMLQDIDEEEEIDAAKEAFDTEPINPEDIRSFMEDIGLADLRRQRKIKEEEEKEREREENPRKIKLSIIPGMEDAGPSDEPATQKETSKEKKKKKTKKGEQDAVQDSQISSTTASPAKPKAGSLAFLKDNKPRKNPLVRLEGKWYDNLFPNDKIEFEKANDSDVKRIEQYAAKLMEMEIALYRKQEETKRRSDTMWIRTVLKSGTVGDRIAALTILVQDSPVHNLANLDLFLQMMTKKGRREALSAIDTIKDLFISDLLPDRKLKTFDQQPLTCVDVLASGNRDSRDKRLIMWYFEHQLRERYDAFVKSLKTLAQDTIPGPKKKAVSVIHHLLVQKPEQEKVLLELLVNKLGDPDYQVAAKCSHLLTEIVGTHPNMKFVVVMEVERLLYRPNISAKAQYYAICFLNQLVVSHKENKLAARLISIYFSFFKAHVKRGEVDGKTLSSLMTGVHRAFPFAKSESQTVVEQMDTLFKIVHIVGFNTSVHALMLIYHVMETSDKAAERFYMALYKKLLDPELKISSKQTLFLNLLFKSLKKDPSERRVQAFIKRLLQICCQENVPFICASLILLSELVRKKPSLLKLTHICEESDDEEEHFVDIPEEEDGTEKEKHEEEIMASTAEEKPTASWVHRMNADQTKSSVYDPLARNPLYSQADVECTFELRRLADHFHPTVSLWAKNLLKGKIVKYESNPLADFTLIRFLDRFVFRNPKKQAGGSESILSSRRKKSGGRHLAPVNSEDYLKLGEENIPVDEKFFYRYFSQKAAKTETSKADEEESNASDVSDDEFDDYLDTFEKGLMEEGQKELDFAGEYKKQMSKKKKKKGEEESESEEEEDDDDEDLSDEEADLGDMDDEFADFSDDEDEGVEDDMDGDDEDGPGFDEEDVEFSGDDEFAELDLGKIKKQKGKRALAGGEEDVFGKGAKRRKGSSSDGGSGGLFAAADEFSHLLEENMGSKLDSTGSNAFANRDNADVKQIQWEGKRDRWMRDADRRRPNKGFKKGPNFKGKGRGKRTR